MASGDRDDANTKMKQILESLGFGESVVRKFREENITLAVVKDLEKSDFEMLGVTRLGDQKRLRSACNPASPNSSTVIDEVRRVMGYGPRNESHSQETGAGPSQSGFNPHLLIDRCPRRRKQTRPRSTSAVKSNKPRIIKNISVIGYDRVTRKAKQFRPKEVSIVMRGLVEFNPNASEEDIRNNIAAVIQNSEMDGFDAAKYGPNDFEFVNTYRTTVTDM